MPEDIPKYQNTNKKRPALPAFFSKPMVGLIGTIASVIGVFCAVYFYYEGKETPQLTYYVNPARAVVVRAGQASRLTASYDGNVIGTDITAAQVAIWNDGKRAIKRDIILEPLVIQTENTPILEATIRKTTRAVTQIAIDNTELQKGRVKVSWNILERNDGAVIQLIYAGNPNVNIQASGVIEGQSQLYQQQSQRAVPSDDNPSALKTMKRIGVGITLFGILVSLVAIYILVRKVREGRFKWRNDFIAILAPLVMVFGLIYFLFLMPIPGPPFGF